MKTIFYHLTNKLRTVKHLVFLLLLLFLRVQLYSAVKDNGGAVTGALIDDKSAAVPFAPVVLKERWTHL